MNLPPVTGSDCPVIHDASSLHRKETAAAMSSHVPSRFQASMVDLDRSKQLRDLGGLSNIGLSCLGRKSLSAKLFHHPLSRILLRLVVDDHMRALSGQPDRNPHANTARASSHKSHFSRLRTNLDRHSTRRYPRFALHFQASSRAGLTLQASLRKGLPQERDRG
jgi:hypothetical protein